MTTKHVVIAILFAAAGCATTPTGDDIDGHGGIPHPMGDGKQDGEVSCGASSCSASQCAYDCTTAGALCTEACEADGLANAYVTASVSGAEQATFDSRKTEYKPRLALDNVLIYGCDVWDYRSSNPHHQGLEIEYTELVHSSFAVDPNDPTRYQRKLDVYVGQFTGPGDYRGEGAFSASNASTRYVSGDGCAVHFDASGDGTFNCTLPSAGGSSVSVTGSFSCPGNAIDNPIFVAWQPS